MSIDQLQVDRLLAVIRPLNLGFQREQDYVRWALQTVALRSGSLTFHEATAVPDVTSTRDYEIATTPIPDSWVTRSNGFTYVFRRTRFAFQGMNPIDTIQKDTYMNDDYARNRPPVREAVLGLDGRWQRSMKVNNVLGKRVKGHTEKGIACNAACIYARGPLCSCSCGGKNHGGGFAIYILDMLMRDGTTRLDAQTKLAAIMLSLPRADD